MYLTWPHGAAALEAFALLCAALNSVYFAGRSLDAIEPAGRRVAASVLALVSLGTLAEAAALVALTLAGRESVAPWDLVWVRAPAIAGAAAMSAIVLRRLVRR